MCGQSIMPASLERDDDPAGQPHAQLLWRSTTCRLFHSASGQLSWND